MSSEMSKFSKMKSITNSTTGQTYACLLLFYMNIIWWYVNNMQTTEKNVVRENQSQSLKWLLLSSNRHLTCRLRGSKCKIVVNRTTRPSNACKVWFLFQLILNLSHFFCCCRLDFFGLVIVFSMESNFIVQIRHHFKLWMAFELMSNDYLSAVDK